MATNPDDIRLSEEQRKRLAVLADERSASWTEVIRELIDSAEATLGIEHGLASAARGEGIPVEDVHTRLRTKFDLDGK